MSDKKEQINNILKDIIGDIGYYLIASENKIMYTITETKLSQKFKDKSSYKIELPSIKAIKEKAKKFYKNFDEKILDNLEIVYFLEKAKFSKPIMVDTDAYIFIHDCKFNNGLTINSSDCVNFCSMYNINSFIECYQNLDINAKYITLSDSSFRFHDNWNDKCNINLSANKIYIDNFTLESRKNLEINAKALNIKSSNLLAPDIIINSEEICAVKNYIKASNSISINNENCDSVDNVYAPIILYNGQDITKTVSSKAPQQLIEVLTILRDKCNNGIKEETKAYEDSLRNQPLSKRLKK